MTGTSEGEVATACDRMLEDTGWKVERYEQSRSTMIELGIPDRRYVHIARGLRLWVELKGSAGQLTLEQHLWLGAELAADSLATVISSRYELHHLLEVLAGPRVGRQEAALKYCRELVRLCALRGYRRKSGRRRPRSSIGKDPT